MSFKSIFIANLAEIARPLVKLMDKERGQEEVWEDHWLCDRFLFANTDNRLLITPVAIEKVFFSDSCRLLGFQNTLNWWPERVQESICEEILSEKEFLEKIIQVIKQNPGISLCAYAATEEFSKLTEELRKRGLDFSLPEAPEEKNRWVASFFGSKSGFRQAVAFLGRNFPAMPEGGICSRKEEIVGWGSYLLNQKAGCVLKANRGLAGVGLRIIKKEEINPGQCAEEFLTDLVDQERYWQEDQVVVEEYIPANSQIAGGNPNVELRILPSGEVKVLYPCGMRVTAEGNFRGVEIGKEAVPKEVEIILLRSGRQWGGYLQKMGYQGFFEIDFIARSLKEIYPLEANLRRTGGTHVHELAERLLGQDYQANYYLVANNLYPVPKFKKRNYLALKTALKEVLFPLFGKKEGVVITVANLLQKGQLGYVVVAENKKRAEEIEKKFQDCLR